MVVRPSVVKSNLNFDCSAYLMNVESYLNFDNHPITSERFRVDCKRVLDTHGLLKLDAFLNSEAVKSVRREADTHANLAYFASAEHNVYLSPSDPGFEQAHPRNRTVCSSKGCITTDQIPEESLLHQLYHDDRFKSFLCAVLGEDALYEYDDPLSSINLHYASQGQELGWHFDNSSFAITLLIQKPAEGGVFEYVSDTRDANAGDMNFAAVESILNGETSVSQLEINPGDLVLFRGRNSLHRVTPVSGDVTRLLVVLAYNTEPGIALSESARRTFYGRLG